MSSSSPQVPRDTVSGAVASLTKWMRARAAGAAPNLLSDERDEPILLLLSLRRVPAASSSPAAKPHLLPLPHPLLTSPYVSVCLISDDRPKSSSPSAAALLDAAKSLDLPVSDTIPLSALRTDYRPYESRRRLVASHDLFVADRAILPCLPSVLGKAFYSTKKAPLAVDFSRVGWPEQLRRILSSTFLYFRSGTCSGIKVGRLDMEEDHIVENVMAVIDAAVEKVPKKWANVRSLHLRAVESVALPIYQAVPENGMKIDVPKRMEMDAGEVVDAVREEVEEKGKKKKKALRYVDGHGEEQVDNEEEVKEETGRRRRKKHDALEVEAGGETEKKKRRKKGARDEDDAVEEVEEVDKKKSRKKESKRALEVESDKEEKKRKKGKGDDVEVRADEDNELGVEEEKSKKKKKKQAARNVKHEEAEAVGANSVASVEEVAPAKEKKKSKANKSDSEKAKKTRTKMKV